MNYPKTKKAQVADNYFGTPVPDPYRWMEEADNPGLEKWIEQQNALTNQYLEKIPYRQNIRNRLEELWNYSKYSAPFYKSGKYFFLKNDGIQNQSVLYMQESLQDAPAVLLDPNKLSDDGTVSLSGYSVSANGKLLAYALSRSGSDWQEIHVRNTQTLKDTGDIIKWVKFSSISWKNDGFFYSGYEKPPEGEEYSVKNTNQKIFYHKIGSNQEEDVVIHWNSEYPEHFYHAKTCHDESFLVIYEMKSTHGNNIYIKNLNLEKAFTLQLTTGFEYNYSVVDIIDNKLYMLTDNEAPNYRLIMIDLNSNELWDWQDIIPEGDNLLMEVRFSGQKVIAHFLEDAKSRLSVFDMKGNHIKDIDLPSIGTASELECRYDHEEIFFSFNSFNFPDIVYKTDPVTFKKQVHFKSTLAFEPDNYVVNQVFYESKDKTKIPMFIVHKKGIELDGNNPVLLYGYGGFNISLTPGFKVSRLYWMEQGGIYAVANLRGGGEYGEKWHQGGMVFNKQNVFDDFIAAAEYLINERYTNPKKLAIMGGSNGGLLVGAVINQRPELFGAAVPAVGVMDMLRFHKFTIGYAWVDDYGCSEDSAEFVNLYKYSPLHNINKNKNYPAVLVTTADHDDRVVPAHSFKYVATLQEKRRNNKKPLLIRIQTKAGHGAGKPVSMQLEEITDVWAFILHNLNEEIIN